MISFYEYEWKFVISKLHFCKTLLRNLKIEKATNKFYYITSEKTLNILKYNINSLKI